MDTEVDLRELAIDRGGAATGGMRGRRRLLTRLLAPLALIVGFMSLVAWASRDALFPPQPVTVIPVFATTAESRPTGAPLFQAAGWIEPRPTPVRAAALAPGVVERLLVVEDQLVAQGEPLAELIKDDARLEVERAAADLELREAELDEAEAAQTAAATRFKQPVHLTAALGEAAAALAKIETLRSNLPFEVRRAASDRLALQRDYEGKRAAAGVVAGVQIDIARSKAEAAQALVEELRERDESLRREQQALIRRRDALQTQLELLADEIKARDEAAARVRAAAARVAQARVAVAEARLRLERMTVVSPIDGRVFRLIAHPGARIGGGMTQMAGHDGSTVVTLYRPDHLQIRVDVRFEDVPQVQLNQPVEIGNPALDAPLVGRVLFVSSEADIQKNTLQVKVDIPEAPALFKPEMLVDVTFLAPPQAEPSGPASRQWRLFVLQSLIERGEQGDFVWVADQSEGVARKVSIETGAAESNGLVQVLSGLTMSSRLIVEGRESLRDGGRIRVTREDPSLGKP